MSMSDHEFEYLESVIAAFEDNPERCSEWERGFMKDQATRVKKYGADTLLSQKQWGVINRVAETYDIKSMM